MAIDSHAFPGTLDRTAYQYEDDYSDMWEVLKEPSTRLTFLDLVPEGKPVKNPDFYWMEDIVNPYRYLTINGALTTETTFVVDTPQASYVQPGDLLRVEGVAADAEIVQVLTTDDATSFTVTRAYGGSTQVNVIPDNTVLRRIRLKAEGSEVDDFEYKGTVRYSNTTGIISHSIRLDGSAMEGKPRGYQTAELDRQEAEILLTLKSELEDLVIFGPGATRASGEYGVPSGIRDTIKARAGSNIGAAAVTWAYKQVNERINWLVETGGMVNDASNLVLLCPASMYSAAGFWGAGACTRQASDRTYGYETNTIHSTLGLDVPMVWSYKCQPDEYMIVDLSRLSIHPLGSRRLKRWVKPAGIDLNDYEARRLLMEWGVRLRYADKAHYLQTLVTVV
jgi:hypothetical protein